ncbi:MAG: tRNA uridine-5-carboxymethylaminomethyl(34) synthesis GTPase MnmE [Anaerolineae bacterium]
MITLEDTIAAVSTPLGQGGIGIVRLSGPDVLSIARRLFVPSGRAWAANPASHHLYHGAIVDPATGRRVDEVLLAYMRAPRTYTRQDVVEINAHGGLVAQREVLALCLAQGARMAQGGEFTLRAFANGRIDLAQAEAVLDVICARTGASLHLALDQMGGRLSQRVRALREQAAEILAYLEAGIDFPEEDIPQQDPEPTLRHIAGELAELLAETERGMLYREGLRAAIIGRPNVGKSSLLNALLRTDRAIVTPLPGTTRDTLEEAIDLQGVPLVLVDTAGITESADPIERLGIARSRLSAERADLVLVLVDGNVSPSEEDRAIAELAQGKAAVVVLNKSDLPSVSTYDEILPAAPHVHISALTGQGIAALEALLLDTVLSGQVAPERDPVSGNPRHHELFRRALEHTHRAQAALADGRPIELAAIDVSEVVHALGEVTGETAGDDLLENIFGRFCIGK